MNKAKKLIAIFLVLSMVFALSISAFADEKVLYVNYGDSIAKGSIEADDPDYDRDKDSFSALFGKYLDAERVNYARSGMQTTDILYMIDDQFREDVDNGVIVTDSWHWEEYPPNDNVPLDQIKKNTALADYITLCVGVCDYISYPGEVKSVAMEDIPDTEELSAALDEYLNSGKLEKEAYLLLSELLEIYKEKAVVIISYIFDMLEGYSDYVKYYPQIVKDLRDLNNEGTIILIGNYLPGDFAAFLAENDEASFIIPLVNRLLDNINLVVKEAAKKYGCVYVDTMGIESEWHPTVDGQQQICDRIVSVLSGEKTYAGSVKFVTTIVEKFLNDVSSDIDQIFGFAGELGSILASLKAFTNKILSAIFDSISLLFRGAGVFC